MMKLLFYGFRHSHIYALYQKASESESVDIVACIEPNTAARSNAEQALGVVFTERSYDELLGTDIDAVAIGCAYGDRGQAVIKALKAGKHVIADKPLCTRWEELTEIRAISEEKNLKIACMLELRYLPQVLRAKEILDSGRLGQVRNLAFNGQHCIDYAHRPTWYFEENMHGGTINDLAIHGIDLVRRLTGLEFQKIDAARVWNAYATKHKGFKDSAIFMARLENGAGVLADVSYSAPSQVFSLPTYWEFRVWCDKGMLSFHYTDGKVTLYEEGTPNAVLLAGTEVNTDYLLDFVKDCTTSDRSETEEMLRSTATALRIQQEADKEEMQ